MVLKRSYVQSYSRKATVALSIKVHLSAQLQNLN
jgi:hypothetical protein